MGDGVPVIAATGNEWAVDILLSYSRYSISFLIAGVVPYSVQAFYNSALEPFFTAAVPQLAKLKKNLPAPANGGVVIFMDVCIVTSFLVYVFMKGALICVAGAIIMTLWKIS